MKVGMRKREGERRENYIFYNLIIMMSTLFTNATGNTIDALWYWLNMGLLLWVLFCGFFFLDFS